MILGDADIVGARAIGQLVIEPFDKANLGSDTYDVRLGEFYYTERGIVDPGIGTKFQSERVYNPLDKLNVVRVWGQPKRASRYQSSDEAPPEVELVGFKSTDRVIWLAPGATILGHTIEFIGGVQGLTTKMYARSSVGRSMVGVCKCAGKGDVGYINRWTMEITSFSQHHWIPLKVGMRIAQIEFVKVQGAVSRYDATRKYQNSTDIEQVMQSWVPDMMLPRLHMDKELTYG